MCTWNNWNYAKNFSLSLFLFLFSNNWSYFIVKYIMSFSIRLNIMQMLSFSWIKTRFNFNFTLSFISKRVETKTSPTINSTLRSKSYNLTIYIGLNIFSTYLWKKSWIKHIKCHLLALKDTFYLILNLINHFFLEIFEKFDVSYRKMCFIDYSTYPLNVKILPYLNRPIMIT